VLTEFAVARQRVVLSARHRSVLRLVVAERERFPDLAQIYWERGPQRSGRQLITYFEALRNREVLAIDDAEEAAEFFIGMLFQRWLRPLYYTDAPPPSELAIRTRAERVVAFWARTAADHTERDTLPQSGTPGCAAPSSHAAPSA
jgi:hypothetical protein